MLKCEDLHSVYQKKKIMKCLPNASLASAKSKEKKRRSE